MANADIANQTDVIILNRMYVGGYLGENIGHEVINLMKPDEGDDYYIYINARGDLREEFITKEWRAKTILLTRWCTYEYKDEGNNNTKKLSYLEVLGKIGTTDVNDKKYIKPWTLEKTIKEKNECVKNIIKADYKNFNDKFHKKITIKENDVISDILMIEKYYDKILRNLQEIYKKTGFPISIYSIDRIKNLEDKERLKINDKDKTGKYKIIDKQKQICTKEDVEKNKKYLIEREKYYNKPLQKLKHILQVTSLEKVTYGKKSLETIFKKNARNDIALYVTFTSKDVKMIKQGYHIYLVDDMPGKNVNFLEGENAVVINVNIDKNKKEISKKLNFAITSLRQYIDSNNYKDVYNNILNQLEQISDGYWEPQCPLNFEGRKKLEPNNPHYIDTNPNKANFIDIIRKNYDELVYSNLFYYIFKTVPNLFIEFINKFSNELGLEFNIPKNYESYTVLREEGDIDLLIDIRDKNENIYLIVIENKIKSSINGIKYDERGEEVGNQLSKYIHYAHGYKVAKGSDKTKYEYKKFDDEEFLVKPYNSEKCKRAFFIFAPLYKHFNIEEINKYMHEKAYFVEEEYKQDDYKLITYDKIYKFFNDKLYQNKDIPYFKEFLYAIKAHQYESDNIQEQHMFERFAQMID